MRYLVLAAAFAASITCAGPVMAADSITDNYNGEIIKLDDGSVWRVSPADVSTSQSWTSGDDVVAGRDDDKLFNIDDGEEVEAERLR